MGYGQACSFCFFFNDTATTEIYTLSLHDALPISVVGSKIGTAAHATSVSASAKCSLQIGRATSELQSHSELVCRLLLEKKKKRRNTISLQNNQTEKPQHHTTK